MALEYRKERGRPGRGDGPAPSVRKGVYIPVLVLEAMQGIAERKGITLHAAMREAFAEWVERHGEG